MNNNKADNFILTLNQKDVVGLYLSLKKCNDQLNESSARIVKKIEQYLYDILTIDQFARIDDFYSEISS